MKKTEECTKQITKHILNAAVLSIPKITTKGRKKVVPWWNEECSRAVKELNKAFRMLKKNVSQENVMEYQRKRAVACRTIKYTKKRDWREFCSSIQ